jgi:hypothetical protein
MAQAETPPGRAGDSLEGQEIPKAETAKAASAKVKMAREAKADAAGSVGAARYLQALRTPSVREWPEASRRPT